jgi:hypothetical protein
MIKRPFTFIVSVMLLIVALGFGAERTLFLLRAKKTTGTVVGVTASNDRCGSGRSRRYECTRFGATVEFTTTTGATAIYRLPAGSSTGHGQPVTLATLHEGGAVRIVYDPKHPQRAYRDTARDVWGTPVATAFGGVLAMVTSFFERRSRRYS